MNMLAMKECFQVGHEAFSQTQLANITQCTFLDKGEIHLRLIDTQGLSDTGGDKRDMDHIKNMVGVIKKLQYIDLFIICFDGNNPRFTSYAQSTITLFKDIFSDFLDHSVLVFNKWKTPNEEKRFMLEKSYKELIEKQFGKSNIPCYFLDSNFHLPQEVMNEDGDYEMKFLPPKAQERTRVNVIRLGNYLNIKQSRCDVRSIKPKNTEITELKEREQKAFEIAEIEKKTKELELAKAQKIIDKKEIEKRDAQEREKKALTEAEKEKKAKAVELAMAQKVIDQKEIEKRDAQEKEKKAVAEKEKNAIKFENAQKEINAKEEERKKNAKRIRKGK